MTNSEMAEILFYRVGPAGTELSNTDANYLLEALRRDWAVRVLDAWCAQDEERFFQCGFEVALFNSPDSSPRLYDGRSFEDARLAAAEAVWPELPESVRAEIGERP